MTDQPFADAVKRLLERKGMSLRALARETGLDPGFLSRVMQGQKPPSQKVVRAVAQFFDLDPSFFIEARQARVAEALNEHPRVLDRVYDQVTPFRTGMKSPGGERVDPRRERDERIERVIIRLFETRTPEGPLARLAAAAVLRAQRDKRFSSALMSYEPDVEELARLLGCSWLD